MLTATGPPLPFNTPPRPRPLLIFSCAGEPQPQRQPQARYFPHTLQFLRSSSSSFSRSPDYFTHWRSPSSPLSLHYISHSLFQPGCYSVQTRAQPTHPPPLERRRHWSPQYCHCSLDLTAPVYRIVGWQNMTEAASAAIVPAASSRARGLEIAEFLDDRMRSNHERKGKKTGAGNTAHKVGGLLGGGGEGGTVPPVKVRLCALCMCCACGKIVFRASKAVKPEGNGGKGGTERTKTCAGVPAHTKRFFCWVLVCCHETISTICLVL